MCGVLLLILVCVGSSGGSPFLAVSRQQAGGGEGEGGREEGERQAGIGARWSSRVAREAGREARAEVAVAVQRRKRGSCRAAVARDGEHDAE